LFLGLTAISCGGAAMYGTVTAWSEWGPPRAVGRIEPPEIKESSGLSASECQDVLWTHNDAGNEPLIYAMNLEGKHVGTWRVPNVRNIDWESIATYKEPAGKCSLLIGDIGDNDTVRTDTAIYWIPEPVVTPETAKSTGTNPLESAPAQALRFKYPDGPKNAETLLVHPRTGNIYILTKMKTGPSQIHRLNPNFGSETVAVTQKVGEISLPTKPEGLLTGGSFSPDGTRVMLCDVKNGYELVSTNTSDPDTIWKQTPRIVDLGERKQGEGVSYGRDGYSLYASSEKKNTPLIKIERKRT
jgi:hypothetical protein